MMFRRIAGCLTAAVLVATMASAAAAQDEELRMGDDPAYFERVELPEAGIALSYPPDWGVDVLMEYGHTQPGDPYTGRWWVVRGSTEDASCGVWWYLYPGPSLVETDAGGDDGWVTGLGGEVVEVELPIGTAARAVFPDGINDGYTTNYEIDADGMRWELACYSEERAADDWLGIAETLEWLPAEDRLARELEPPSEGSIAWAPGSYELERVELPEAGIAMELPQDWQIDVVMEERELVLPSDRGDEGPVSYMQAFSAEGATGDWCNLQVHPEGPLTLREHAELLGSTWLADDPEGWHANVGFTVIGGELAEQVDLLSEADLGIIRAQIWDSGSDRLVLTCGTDLVYNRDWRAMAESVELLDGGPEPAPEVTPEGVDDADVSAEVVDSWESDSFDKFVYVSETETMRAVCDRAVWNEFSDGTWTERIDCQLSSEPVDLPAEQGEIPTQALTYGGGACEWASYYWLEEDGSEVWAESWSMLIEPDGSVAGLAMFGAEALDCVAEGEQNEDLSTSDDPPPTQRVEVPEAGIAMAIPADWTHEIVMERGEYQLPAEFDDGSTVPYTIVSSATSPDQGACLLTAYEDMPLSLERQAQERAIENASSFVDEDPVITDVQRSAGPAVRLDFMAMLGWAHEYLFEMDGLRYVLSCFDEDLGDETFWPIADSIEPLDTAPADEPDTTDPAEASIDDRRVEFPDLGIGLTIPHFWTYELRTEETDYPLPDEYGEDATAPRTQFLSAFPFPDGVCWVSTYADMPMDPERHAREHGWAQYVSPSEADPETERVQLPAGEAYRVVYYSFFGGSVAYVFDVAGSRYMVDCVVGDDGGLAARSLAASITALGDEPPELGLQRLEFADADIAVTLPVDWEVQSVMDFIDTINVAGPDAPESDLWVVMGAYPDEETSCDIFMLGDIPLSLEDHGDGFAALAAASDPPREATVEALTLPIGDAVRVTETSEEGRVTTQYLFDVGGNREYLRCSTPEQPEDAWLSVAESIESLSGASPAPEPEPEPETGDGDLFDPDAFGLERREFAEAGVSVALPPDWAVELLLEQKEDSLPDAYADAGPISFVDLLMAESDVGEWCQLRAHPENPMPLHDHASWELAQWSAAFPDASIELYSTQDGSETRYIVVYSAPDSDEGANLYFFETGGERYQLDCAGVFGPDSPWDAIAASVAPLGAPPEPEPEQDLTIQRIEVPEAGIRLELPAEWEIVSETESQGPAFLPEGVSDTDVEVWKTLMGYSVEDQQWCSVYVYDGIHLSLDDHAVWFGELEDIMGSLFPDPPPAAIETGSLVLPIGDAATYTQTAEDGDVSISYLFDLAGNREYLVCGGPSLPDDAWLSVAETIVPLGVPDDAVGWSEVTDIVTVLPVSGPEHETYMTAECGQALWIEYGDGSFEEQLTCILTDEPVDPPEDQGGLPQESSTLSGGECEWVSDFWAETDGSDAWASSWSVTIEGDGRASATSWYAPEELDCDD